MECAGCEKCPMIEQGFSGAEIHVTVREQMRDGRPTSIEQFKKDCASAGIKALLIHLQGAGSQMMSSSTTTGDFVEESGRVVHELREAGYQIARVKVELSPWHTLVVDETSKGLYWESHFPIRAKKPAFDMLKKAFEEEGLRVSNSEFKPGWKMCTIRTHAKSRNEHELKRCAIEQFISSLAHRGLVLEKRKTISEYVFLDTNLELDAAWV